MMEARRELDLLGSFSHASDPPSTMEVRDRFEVFHDHDFLDVSLSSTKSTSGSSDGDQPIQSVSPVSEELPLSITPAAGFPSSSGTKDQRNTDTTDAVIPKQDPQPGTSSLTFRFRVSWGSKNSRYHALKPKITHRIQKPPIRPIRVSKQTRDKKERLKEAFAAVGLLMLANHNPWKITKILTDSDLNHQSRLLISKAQVQDQIIPHLDGESRDKIYSNDGLTVSVRDFDTDQVHQLRLKWWHSSRSFNLQGGWISNFVERRHLKKGDKIGLFWSRTDNMIFFSVLQRAKAKAC